MNSINWTTRRGFMGDMFSAGALVLVGQVPPVDALAATQAESVLKPNVWLGIEPNGSVVIVAHRSELGQGIRTALPRVVADELDADWKRVTIEQAIGDPRYGRQDTDGSKSVRDFFDIMREAGATARLMLVRAAAPQWNVPVSECISDLHAIVHRPTNRRLGYGELATAASKLPVPKKEEIQLKAKSAWRYIGKSCPSYDLKDLCTGKAVFGMDSKIEGMVYASIEHPPVLGGKVKSLDDVAALKVSGVRQVVPIDPFKPPAPGYQPLGGSPLSQTTHGLRFRAGSN